MAKWSSKRTTALSNTRLLLPSWQSGPSETREKFKTTVSSPLSTTFKSCRLSVLCLRSTLRITLWQHVLRPLISKRKPCSAWLSPISLTSQIGFLKDLIWIITHWQCRDPLQISIRSIMFQSAVSRLDRGRMGILQALNHLVHSLSRSRRLFWSKISYTQWAALKESSSKESIFRTRLTTISWGQNSEWSLIWPAPPVTILSCF